MIEGKIHAAMVSGQFPVLVSLGAKPAEVLHNPISGAAWQPATEALFQNARRVETLLAAMFAGAPSQTAEAQLPQDLLAALAQLHATSDTYLHAVSQPARGSDK